LIIVPSRIAKSSFVKRGFAPEKIANVCLGVDPHRFARKKSRKDGCFRMLFVGQLSVRKGVHTLAAAFSTARIPNSELLLVGGKKPETDAILEPFRNEKVRLIGPVPHSELPALYQSADLFVLPSFEDGFGMVAMEAWAAGCRVAVSSNVGAADLISEVERDAAGVMMFEAGDHEGLARIMQNVAGSRNEFTGPELSDDDLGRIGWARYGEQVRAQYQRILM
jgi:glycosyltransferase involved in cell wall biosynthesis